jgi:hypothetical protein
MMNLNDFVSYAVVQDAFGDNLEARHAITRSRDTFADFVHALRHRSPAQNEFLVTVMRRTDTALVPVGILVEKIADGQVEGNEVPNFLVKTRANPVVCREEHVVDWRYVDTFELVGGHLYRNIFNKQPEAVQIAIGEKQLFLMDWYKPMEVSFRDLCRDIANLRYEGVQRALRDHPELARKKAYAVVPGPEPLGSRLRPHTVATYAARFADSRMMVLLHELKAFPGITERGLLLEEAVSQGNADTALALLELGLDIEGGAEEEWWPLWCAVRWDREAMVAILLAKGADPNRRDEVGRTPLFTCRSVEIARRLLAAGASPDVCDQEGMALIEHHAIHGRVDLVDILNMAAENPMREVRVGLSEQEIRQRGREALRSHFSTHDPAHLTEMELMNATDYGYVLPVRRLPIP